MPLPRGENGYTPNSTGDADNQTSGASFRVAETANWDNAVGTKTPGQSGNPDDPHYRDLFGMWATGNYFPLAYSRPKVESVTESRTVLQPRRWLFDDGIFSSVDNTGMITTISTDGQFVLPHEFRHQTG